MSSPNKSPASLRYLKARLQPFGRPAFWASACGLLLLLLFAWEFWENPNWLSTLGRNQSDSSANSTDDRQLSSEDLAAIGADIDNSSVLSNEIDLRGDLPILTPPNKKTQTPTSEGFFAQFTRQQAQADSKQEQKSPTLIGTVQQPQNSTNPFATSAQENLNTNPLSRGVLFPNLAAPTRESSSSTGVATLGPSVGVNPVNSFNTNRGALPVSPLQEALNRSSANSPTATNQAQIPANPPTQALPTSTYPTSQGQITYPPATVPGAMGYNTSPTTPTAPHPSMRG
ncbi:MAG: hypothetical protein ICV55_09870 [Coleofasciculus sp. C3-bin4]|nr:hypothetical protein [Coleofasciculus sp. C3-bin4]